MFVTSDINSNKSGMPAATKGGAYWRFSPTTVVPSPPPPPLIPAPRLVGEKNPTDILFTEYTKRPVFFSVFCHFHHEHEVILKFLSNIKFATHTRFFKKYLA